MSDCTNLEMRDVLPDLARGALTGPSLVAVERHLAECASCRAELAMVRNAQSVLGATPRVDTSRIAAAVVRSAKIRREATAGVAQTRRRRAWNTSMSSRRMWLAAASLVAVAGAAALATRDGGAPSSGSLPPVVVTTGQPNAPMPGASEPAEPGRPAASPAARGGLAVGGGLTDLADADLESLLRELEGLEPQFDVEPASLLPVLEGDV